MIISFLLHLWKAQIEKENFINELIVACLNMSVYAP